MKQAGLNVTVTSPQSSSPGPTTLILRRLPMKQCLGLLKMLVPCLKMW